MAINRRDFMKTSMAAACAGYAAANAWGNPGQGMVPIPGTGVRVRGARAGGGNIVVFVQLRGGNDGLNTVYPLDGTQRSLYEETRPTLAVSNTVEGLSDFKDNGFGGDAIYEIGANDDGNRYAFHPSMGALFQLYQDSKLAVIPGVHYPFANRSHFASMGIWETGNPADTGAGGSGGWFGRYLNQAGIADTDVSTVLMGRGLNPMFTPTTANLFAFRSLSQLRFPANRETELKSAAFERICNIVDDMDANTVPELVKIAQTGKITVQKIKDYYLTGNDLENAGAVEALLLDENGRYRSSNPLVYNSPLNEANNSKLEGMRLARDLRHVAATIRANVGAQFFHISLGGFDTHSSQEKDFFHSNLLQQISESTAAFYREMNQSITLPAGYEGYDTSDLASKVVIYFFSEFGRTINQNAVDSSRAGTDHAASAVQFVLGGNVIGGQYGAYPQIENPSSEDDHDLRLVTDYRDVFGTILNKHLGVGTDALGPADGKILSVTPEPDADGNSYTAFTPLGFLS